MVLMKGFDKNGIVFFTNYNSRKGNELVKIYLIIDLYRKNYYTGMREDLQVKTGVQ